jgi:hypothetical protein
MSKQYQQFSPGLINSYMQQAGIDPATGKSDPNYNPNDSLNSRLYSDSAIGDRASKLFDPSQLTGDMTAQQEATDGQYDNALSSLRANSLQRGFGYGSTGVDSAANQVGIAQAQDNAGARRGLLQRLLSQKQNYIESQQGKSQNLLENGQSARQQNLAQAGNFLSGSASQGMGGLGGLQGFYAKRASDSNANMSNMIGEVAKSGAFDGIANKAGELFNRVIGRKKSGGITGGITSPGSSLGSAGLKAPVGMPPLG